MGFLVTGICVHADIYMLCINAGYIPVHTRSQREDQNIGTEQDGEKAMKHDTVESKINYLLK
jgi:hypothetical protein